jgi:hypothetical protein
MNDIYKPKKSFLVTKHPLPSSLEPSSVTVALADSRWREAMSLKLTALMCHNTWQLVPLQLIVILLAVNGCFGLKGTLMGLLIGSKPS